MVYTVSFKAAIVPFKVIVDYVSVVCMHMLSSSMRLPSTGNVLDGNILLSYLIAFPRFWLSTRFETLYLHFIYCLQKISLIEFDHLGLQLISSILSVHECFLLFSHRF